MTNLPVLRVGKLSSMESIESADQVKEDVKQVRVSRESEERVKIEIPEEMPSSYDSANSARSSAYSHKSVRET